VPLSSKDNLMATRKLLMQTFKKRAVVWGGVTTKERVDKPTLISDYQLLKIEHNSIIVKLYH